jgi:hypothetical protein
MFLDVVASYKKLADYNFEKLNTDDFFDKLSRRFSAIMMIVFTTILGVFQLVGKPLECWLVKLMFFNLKKFFSLILIF